MSNACEVDAGFAMILVSDNVESDQLLRTLERWKNFLESAKNCGLRVILGRKLGWCAQTEMTHI